MILYMLEKKITRIMFKIRYYGPGWYNKKIDPKLERYFRVYLRKYIKYTDDLNWPLWAQASFLLISMVSTFFFLVNIKLIAAFIWGIIRPFCIFYFTLIGSWVDVIILFVNWLLYYPLLFVNWLLYYPLLFLKFVKDGWNYIVRSLETLTILVVRDGIIATLRFIRDWIIDTYFDVVVFSDGWLHFLLPYTSALIHVCKTIYLWLIKNWWSLLKYYIFYRLLRRFYRWYVYKVPRMHMEWFAERGPTMLFIYHSRVCSFGELWAIYKEKVYDFMFGSLMFICYIFQDRILAFIKRYLRNTDGFRITVRRAIKRKFRKPIFRVLVRFHLLFLPLYYFIQYWCFYFFTLGKMFLYAFPDFLLIIAVLLFISFLWLNFHKFFFDYFIFFVLNKLGFRFPRSTLYTQPIKSRASDLFPISRKFKSSLVSLRLSSLVDLKNTNVYLVHSNKLFSQLPFLANYPNFRRMQKNMLKYALHTLGLEEKSIQSRKYISTNLGRMDEEQYGMRYRPFGESFVCTAKVRTAVRLSTPPYFSRHFNFIDKFNLLHYSSFLRYSRLKGSVFLPKFISNKFDFNTLVLKELLLLCNSSSSSSQPPFNQPNYSILNIINSLEFFNSTGNLSIPSLSFFGKSDFFFFDKNFNKISANRKASLLSDLCNLFLGRFNFIASINPTVFYSTPIYRHRTGGNFKYKNVYSYKQRSIVNGVKFLNNFKVLASFPRKRIRIYNPYNTKFKVGGLLHRYLKLNRVTETAILNFNNRKNMRNIWRQIPRYFDARGTARLIRQFVALRKRKRRKVSFDFLDHTVFIRSGSRALRKFFYNKFIFNKFNKKFSFYKKRQKIYFNKSIKNPKIAFLVKPKFSGGRNRAIFPAIISKSVNNRSNNFNFFSFSAKLKNLRRNIVFLLKYKNNKKFFKHGTRFLIRSRLFSKRDQINKGRRLRRFFTRSNVYLSFLKSVYSRNVKLLLAVKTISSVLSKFIVNNDEVLYLPLFHVLEKPWWHDTSLKHKNFSYFNFYSGFRSSRGKLGFTQHNNADLRFKLSKFPRRYFGRWILSNRSLSKRYYPSRREWVYLRVNAISPAHVPDWRITYWSRKFRIKSWFYKNYKMIPSILFINPAKDNRRFAFDYVFRYFSPEDGDLSLNTTFADSPGYGGFGPLFYKFTYDFKFRYKYLFRLFVATLGSYLNNLYFIFVFCLVFCSFPNDIQFYLSCIQSPYLF